MDDYRTPRGFVPVLTDVQAEALDAFQRAVLAANSVNAWAYGQEDFPYWHADRALKFALADLYGAAHAAEIQDQVSQSGELPSRVISQYFGIKVTETDSCIE